MVKWRDNQNFHIYYKFPNLKNVDGMFTSEDFVQITRKIHGTNAKTGERLDTPGGISETGKSSPYGSGYKPLILEISKFMINQGMEIQPLPKVQFIDDDTDNAQDILGTTAYYNPQFEGYLMETFQSTSFNDTSDLLQLFIISRLINSNFLGQMLGIGDASINRMFSRSEDRIDGDIAQLFSINSEYGVEGFSDDVYDDDTLYVAGSGDALVGVFFTGSTENRIKLTPGITTFTPKSALRSGAASRSAPVPSRFPPSYAPGCAQGPFLSPFGPGVPYTHPRLVKTVHVREILNLHPPSRTIVGVNHHALGPDRPDGPPEVFGVARDRTIGGNPEGMDPDP